MSGRAGFTLVELLAGLALAALSTMAGVGAVASGLRLLGGLAVRVEADDVVHLAVEALAFDVRRAGLDARAIGVEALADACPDRLTLRADLDDDGAIDAASEEVVTWTCSLAAQKLSRIVGAQSLPLANDVVACGFRYLDAAGVAIAAPAAGLDAATRQRVRAVGLDLAIVPVGLHATSARRVTIALRMAT
jgi:prepilin-type N-terminal cleavage/methylation domain-containing protein